MSTATTQLSLKTPNEANLKEMLRDCNRYLLEPDRANTPGNDQTGERQAANQTRKDVWFTLGSFGNIDKIVRKVTIPQGRDIFAMVASVDDSYAENRSATTPSQLAKRANDVLNTFDKVKLTVTTDVGSGNEKTAEFDQSKLSRVQTDAIELTFAQENPYKDKYLVPGGKTLLVSAAYVALFPLTLGRHKILIEASHPANAELNITSFNVLVEYQILVANLDFQALNAFTSSVST